MTTAIVIAAIVASLACPVHMLWQRRRGRAASCAPAGPDATKSIRTRQEQLAARIEELSRSGSGAA
jgi:hypothetical protein